MSEDEKINPHYLKGFNQGYTIARYEPDLGKELAKVANDAPWFQGFGDGRRQTLLEKLQEQRKTVRKDYGQNGPNVQDKDRDRNKDKER